MIIEFELQGSKCLHKGLFDTTGFWVKYEPEMETQLRRDGERRAGENGEQLFSTIVEVPKGYKLYSHFSFAFYHEDKAIVDMVYNVLTGCLRGSQGRDIEGIGYVRKLNK